MNQFGIMVGFNKPAAFEGWFSKIDDQENDLMLSVIWGYSTHATSKHAFLQFTHSLEQKPYIFGILWSKCSGKSIRLS